MMNGLFDIFMDWIISDLWREIFFTKNVGLFAEGKFIVIFMIQFRCVSFSTCKYAELFINQVVHLADISDNTFAQTIQAFERVH